MFTSFAVFLYRQQKAAMSDQDNITQTEDHVEEAVPHSEIATTVSDMPVDFGDPGVADFPDPAFGETEADEDEDETPGENEPDEDEDDDDEAVLAEEGPDDDEDEDNLTMPLDDERGWE
jgi:hypothetical protein